LSLFNELKRRNVFRVAIAYIVMAWLVMQVADVVLNNIEAPDWVFQVLMLFLGLGFPFAVIFAWAFEMTPDGLKRESEVDRSQSITGQTGKKLNHMITGILVLALAYFAYDKFVVSSERDTVLVDTATQSVPQQPADPVGQTRTIDKSIAVLPFADMSPNKDQEYFSDGLSEELLNLLAKIPELRVAARTSSFSLKGKDMQISEVGEILKVAHVLEGSVRTAGDRIRVTAQLIQSDNGYHLWSETYDRTLNDIFAIQDEIAAKVVEQLKITLLDITPTVKETDPQAYALVLQARHMVWQRTKEAMESSVKLYQQALEIAPDYTAAWTGLAANYHEQAGNGLRPIHEGYRLAREAANRALAIDPDYAPAYAVLGNIAMIYDNDPVAAARLLGQALALEPASLDIIRQSANLVEILGRLDEAIALLEYVAARDPVNTEAHANLARSYRVAGDWDAAIASYQTSLALSPGRIGSYNGIGESWLFKGDAQAALAAYAKEPDDEWRTKGQTMALFDLGRNAEFEEKFTELRERWGDQWPSEIAQVYAYTGNPDEAFAWLEKAVEQNEDGLFQQYYQPLNTPLHTDPRWAEFRQRTIASEAQLGSLKFDVNLPGEPGL
jgi:TolB-like protein/Tfp pilus assembly protein PilF